MIMEKVPVGTSPYFVSCNDLSYHKHKAILTWGEHYIESCNLTSWMNRSWFLFLTLSLSPRELGQQEISLSCCVNKVASNWVTRQLGNTLSLASCFLRSQCVTLLQHRFLYKHKTTHCGPLWNGSNTFGSEKSPQTNLMNHNQLCNPQCTGLFWHTRMSKYNKTAFLIKEKVVNDLQSLHVIYNSNP